MTTAGVRFTRVWTMTATTSAVAARGSSSGHRKMALPIVEDAAAAVGVRWAVAVTRSWSRSCTADTSSAGRVAQLVASWVGVAKRRGWVNRGH